MVDTGAWMSTLKKSSEHLWRGSQMVGQPFPSGRCNSIVIVFIFPSYIEINQKASFEILSKRA